ncbi:hypothetical protein BKA69DRAFT_1129432 [Paraphysoderma sedebokerense]|nr:hypothetical protein BKA69DRAFT_1129432 [Paraphysoderma sedebokerense]
MLTLRILRSPDFYALRWNKTVFFSIIIGSSSAVFYLFVPMHVLNDPKFLSYLPPYWTWWICSFCLYVILIERFIPLSAMISKWSKKMQLMLKLVGPFVLALPQFVAAILFTQIQLQFLKGVLPTPFTSQVYMAMIISGNFVMLISNAYLSLLFIQQIAKHRKQSLYIFITQNRVESAGLFFNLIMAWGFLIIKIIGVAAMLTAPTSVSCFFTNFHNNFNPIIVLNTFGDYIFVTKTLSREILSAHIDTTEHSPSVKKSSNNAPKIAGTSMP